MVTESIGFDKIKFFYLNIRITEPNLAKFDLILAEAMKVIFYYELFREFSFYCWVNLSFSDFILLVECLNYL